MRTIIAVAVGITVLITATSVYLSPNDLSKCGESPGLSSGCEPADAIIAISGGDTTARTKEAVKLYQNGWAEKLIFSGAALDKTGPSNAEAMRRIARDEGVPDGDIITEESSETTKQNAQKTEDILRRNDVSSVILVTSAYHQRRAGLEFRAGVSSNITLRNHPVASDKQWSFWWWLTPTGWFLAISECVKIAAFYLGGTR